MSIASTKANRLLQIETLLLEHSEGLTPAQIARRVGVHRSTIGRYLPDLPKHIYIDVEDGGRWKIDKSAYLINVRLTLHEAAAVHLAARLLTSCMDRFNPHAASALRKLAQPLERLAPHIAQHLSSSADQIDADPVRMDPVFLDVLEDLTLAWANGHRIRVWHRSEKSKPVHEYLFDPYFLEPYALGHSMHAIGNSISPEGIEKLRTFKLERIERVEITKENFIIPSDFDPYRLLRGAWGIWYSDENESEHVKLLFNPHAAGRIRENCWHPTEKITPLEDGSLIWEADIAEPREMMPWLRGWGSEVEVLEPEDIRQLVADDNRKASAIYS